MSEPIQKLGMPKWGLSMTEGRLLEWLVDEGAEIAEGTEVAEVETDKLNGAVESPVAGTLRRRVAGVGEVVPVGGLLGVVADPSVPDADVDAFIASFQESFVPGAEGEDEGPEPDTAQVGLGALRYLRHGDGDESVLLLHGFGGDLNNWLFTAPALAGERSVYALDLPGHGGSVKDAGDGDVETLVGAVAEFMDAVGIERAHLVGHSLGGLVAVLLALRAPERVRTLALVAPAGLGPEINQAYVDGFVEAGSRRELKPALQLLFADEGQVTRQLVDDVLKYKRLDGVDTALRAVAGRAFAGGEQQVAVAQRLSELDAPLLVVWGREDRIIPASHAAAAPSGATVVVLDAVGHSPHMEAAGEVNALLEAHVAGVRAP